MGFNLKGNIENVSAKLKTFAELFPKMTVAEFSKKMQGSLYLRSIAAKRISGGV